MLDVTVTIFADNIALMATEKDPVILTDEVKKGIK